MVVYQILNVVNGKSYIGSTVDFNRRIIEHKKVLRKNKHHSIILQRAWNKYGEKSFIFQVLDSTIEISNLLPLEQKYIDDLKPEYNVQEKAGRSSIVVIQLTKDGEFLREWESVLEAATKLNLHSPNIVKCCKGIRCSTGGFRFKYKNKPSVERKNPQQKLTDNDIQEIRRLGKETNLFHREIANLFNVSQSCVTNIITLKKRLDV